ncbi:tRNA (guanine-N7-)-methyltransferase [Lachnotalea glycerini]|uniref:tRNA (guanine-N(7)-)-methyltransferase n=1 Tax=Lachnotalea glycerini TaxID=1763509 RepID=A0A318EGT6_9FIRM|nr:tRNA (guanosine(46)-N7)-methyltransferase TrmB [Lachnotalea glycerini]PXV85308.1 tRNA (guanine-N7-)-methyltransferase [Lachnotalea glycerini]
MRLRNVKGSNDIIDACNYVIQEPEKGNWSNVFGNKNPIHIEIGMGKGRFITTLAQMNPDINYVGIEKYTSVLVRAIEKISDLEFNNLRFIKMDADNILTVFNPSEVSKIYLNFSDPWPKDRHAKRRLTSQSFFEKYNQILKLDGIVEFKTDNRPLFDFSIEEIPKAGWKIKDYTYDLHNDEKKNKGNVMTEYEEKFSKQNVPINKLIAYRNM